MTNVILTLEFFEAAADVTSSPEEYETSNQMSRSADHAPTTDVHDKTNISPGKGKIIKCIIDQFVARPEMP